MQAYLMGFLDRFSRLFSYLLHQTRCLSETFCLFNGISGQIFQTFQLLASSNQMSHRDLLLTWMGFLDRFSRLFSYLLHQTRCLTETFCLHEWDFWTDFPDFSTTCSIKPDVSARPFAYLIGFMFPGRFQTFPPFPCPLNEVSPRLGYRRSVCPEGIHVKHGDTYLMWEHPHLLWKRHIFFLACVLQLTAQRDPAPPKLAGMRVFWPGAQLPPVLFIVPNKTLYSAMSASWWAPRLVTPVRHAAALMGSQRL